MRTVKSLAVMLYLRTKSEGGMDGGREGEREVGTRGQFRMRRGSLWKTLTAQDRVTLFI
jgi:hypothetical protein